MHTIETTETAFEIKINGEVLVVDLAKMHPTWVAAHLRKAAQRFLNDKYSGESGQTKLDAIRADLADMHKGEAMPERERKASVSTADPVRKMARDLATTFLKTSLEKAMGKDASTWAKNPKTAHLFKTTEKGNVRFDLAAVDAWMVTFAAKQDFMQSARDAMAEAEEQVDLGDLGL